MLLQWHYFVLFNDSSIPLYMDTTSLSINFLPVHSFRLFPCLGYGEQCCYEYKGARIFLDYGFSQTYVQRWDCWIIRQFYFQYFEEPPVFLFTLFTVPRLDKAHVGKQEENLRSCKNCRHVYSLWATATGGPQLRVTYLFCTEQIGSWPSWYNVMNMRSTTSDLSC